MLCGTSVFQCSFLKLFYVGQIVYPSRSAAVHSTRIRTDRWIGMRSFLDFRSHIGFETMSKTRGTLPKIDM